METTTKASFAEVLNRKIDDMFNAEDWHTFNNKLNDITDLVLSLQFDNDIDRAGKDIIKRHCEYLRELAAL